MKETVFTIRLSNPRRIAGEARIEVEQIDELDGSIIRSETAKWCWDQGLGAMKQGLMAALGELMFPKTLSN